MVQRKFAVSTLVFRELFPFAPSKPEDPRSWAQHIRDNLVPEARFEISRYYGQERTYEVKLPGLDYTYAPHRRRLSRFPHHLQLFTAVNNLGLTNWEVYELCNWDCTLYQKNKYIREHPNLKHVRDTTGEDLPTWEDVHGRDPGPFAGSAIEGPSGTNEHLLGPDRLDDEGTDKDDAEVDDSQETHDDDLAIERQGPRISTRPQPISTDSRALGRQVSLSAPSVQA